MNKYQQKLNDILIFSEAFDNAKYKSQGIGKIYEVF